MNAYERTMPTKDVAIVCGWLRHSGLLSLLRNWMKIWLMSELDYAKSHRVLSVSAPEVRLPPHPKEVSA